MKKNVIFIFSGCGEFQIGYHFLMAFIKHIIGKTTKKHNNRHRVSLIGVAKSKVFPPFS